jgi:uroporphyrinogen III methyltransferase/synthase
MRGPGLVSLVGAGPGDPGLITVRGADALSQADLVVYDRLVNERLLDLLPAGAERIFAGKGPQAHTMSQDEINALLVERGREGKRVVRLKGGDPFVFGRGGEEALALAAVGIPFEIIPGVSSAIAAPAYAGIPVTHRGLASSIAFITGHEDPEKLERAVDWTTLAAGADTLVLLMGTGQLAEIADELIAAGRPGDTPVAVIEWGTLPRQRTVSGTLATIAGKVKDEGIAPPAITIVGDVVRLRDELRWFDARSLSGLRVLVTRTREQASELSRRLEEAGAEAIELPTLEIVPRYDEVKLAAAIESLANGDYGWVVFTSTNAVDIFFDAVWEQGHDARDVQANVAAIGSATAETLGWWGIFVDVLPDADAYTAEGLLAAFDGQHDLQGQRVLLPRAEGARDTLIKGLTTHGAMVDEVTLYAAEIPQHPKGLGMERLRAKEIDFVTFASSSSVRNLLTMLGDDLEPVRRARIACIGPITASAVEELLGREPDIVAAEHTIEGLVRALEESV